MPYEKLAITFHNQILKIFKMHRHITDVECIQNPPKEHHVVDHSDADEILVS